MGAIATVNTPAALELFREVILASAAIPVLFQPVNLPVVANGQRYDEMHVDGSAVAQITLYGNAISVPQLAAAAALPPTPRPPDLFIIRNAKLGPEAQLVEPRVTEIAGRAVSTLTKAEAAGDLFRVWEVARRNGFAYHLASIPDEMKLPEAQGFDHDLMQLLYDRGLAMGRAGYAWADRPPMAREAENNLPLIRTTASPSTGAATQP